MIRKILAVVLTVVFFAAAPLSAQVNDEAVKQENIEKLPMKRPILEYVLAVVFLLGAFGIGLTSSKRSPD